MERITLHVGAGKCGSTAIQDALTRRAVIPLAAGGQANYTVIDKDGRVEAGDQVTPRRNGMSRRSADHAVLVGLGAGPFDNLRRALSAVENPVISSESYLSGSEPGRAFLARLGMPVHVVVYVRPQVDYINSAYWQWDAWTGKTPREWIRHRIKRSLWHNKISQWAAMPEVQTVTVRLLPRDVVADFLGVLGASPTNDPIASRSNQSLPGAVLRFLQRHPDLRERYHEELICVLPKLLEGRDLGPVPWLVTPEMAQRIVRDTRGDNERLIEMLDPASAEAMRADRRWWDADAYAGRVAEPVVEKRRVDPGLDAFGLGLFEAAMQMVAADPRRIEAVGEAAARAARRAARRAAAE